MFGRPDVFVLIYFISHISCSCSFVRKAKVESYVEKFFQPNKSKEGDGKDEGGGTPGGTEAAGPGD